MTEVLLFIGGPLLLTGGYLLGRRHHIDPATIVNHDNRLKSLDKKVGIIVDRVSEAKNVSSQTKRLENLTDALTTRLAVEEKETAALYTHIQRLENRIHSQTGREIKELEEELKELGLVPPRGERPIMPQVARVTERKGQQA